MATVYKVEFELTSSWISYPNERVEEIIKDMLDNWNKIERVKGNDMHIRDINIIRKA